MDFGGGDEIRFERIGPAGVVTLTRPTALNALTHSMLRALAAALEAWRDDDSVELVIVKGEGRAFSAGGDLMLVYNSRNTGKPPVDFFVDEYRLNAMIGSYPKPYVALIDGIVMGGGVGISFHGSHRVLTENAVFAMPEVGIGFFPDVGGSHLLPDLGAGFGMYLGLTGKRIRYGDALWSGLATHTIRAEQQAPLFERLIETGEPDLALREFASPVERETDRAPLEAIARHFSEPSLERVVAGLQAEAPRDEFVAATLATIRTRSPTSLHVAFREITQGSTMTMNDCMRMEFRIVNRMLEGHDFYEGIRAVLIDKGDTPRWNPPTLEAVDPADIDRYFAPLGDKELAL
jgi:enoyl-CoA hydratase